jgi:hypothetical protein
MRGGLPAGHSHQTSIYDCPHCHEKISVMLDGTVIDVRAGHGPEPEAQTKGRDLMGTNYVDVERRAAMSTKSQLIRASANELIGKLSDKRMKDFAQRTVLFYLDDLDRVVFGDSLTPPSSPMGEAMRLDLGDMLLFIAEQGLSRLREIVEKYGYTAVAIG